MNLPCNSAAGADVEKVKREVEEVIGLDCSNAILTSAKQGIGIQDVLEAVVKRIPPPPDNTNRPLRALIFDSYYDAYKARLLHQVQILASSHLHGCAADTFTCQDRPVSASAELSSYQDSLRGRGSLTPAAPGSFSSHVGA